MFLCDFTFATSSSDLSIYDQRPVRSTEKYKTKHEYILARFRFSHYYTRCKNIQVLVENSLFETDQS
eukprot:snap_masked-scaffold_18-processed-gene-4.5-mRNA-1 protein AED:1.00 eAED:1.00 QI:0/0/0/0/1/1/2/0/66